MPRRRTQASDNNADEGDLTHKERKRTVRTRTSSRQNRVSRRMAVTCSATTTSRASSQTPEDGLPQGGRRGLRACSTASRTSTSCSRTPRPSTTTPELITRRTEWVAGVLNGTRKSPFSRIKSLTADITVDEARAKGYVKGNLKKEEFFSVSPANHHPDHGLQEAEARP